MSYVVIKEAGEHKYMRLKLADREIWRQRGERFCVADMELVDKGSERVR
jgi:hypothetical protein